MVRLGVGYVLEENESKIYRHRERDRERGRACKKTGRADEKMMAANAQT